MSYSGVKALFEARRERDHVTGDIILLNECLGSEAKAGRPTPWSDCEALLLDLCSEYEQYSAEERRSILSHTASRGMSR